jgi:hypothetical protein
VACHWDLPYACIVAVCLEHTNSMAVSCCRHGRGVGPDVIQFCTVLKKRDFMPQCTE